MNEQQILEKAENIVSFKSHLLVYILVNVFLFGVDIYDNGHVNWAIFSLLGWGIGFVSYYFWFSIHSFRSRRKWKKFNKKCKKS